MSQVSDNEQSWTPHNLPTLGDEEKSASQRVLSSNWVAPGPEVKALEDEFSSFLGLEEKTAVAVSSGSAALFLALWAAGAQYKKVATPVYACSALRNAIALNQAAPLYVDCVSRSAQMNLQDPTLNDAEIVIAAHLFGFPLDLRSVGTKFLIEDVAQSLGAQLAGQALGSFGHAAIFSFYASKMMTSGGHGGMFVSKDRAVAAAVRDYLEFDGRRDEKLRFNFQMTDLQAAIGREQLKKLPSFIKRRKEIYEIYKQAGLPLMNFDKATESSPAYYRAVIECQKPLAIKDELAKHFIKAIVPIEDWEIQSQNESAFPNAFQLSRTTLSLPIFPKLSDQKAKEIADIVLDSGYL